MNRYAELSLNEEHLRLCCGEMNPFYAALAHRIHGGVNCACSLLELTFATKMQTHLIYEMSGLFRAVLIPTACHWSRLFLQFQLELPQKFVYKAVLWVVTLRVKMMELHRYGAMTSLQNKVDSLTTRQLDSNTTEVLNAMIAACAQFWSFHTLAEWNRIFSLVKCQASYCSAAYNKISVLHNAFLGRTSKYWERRKRHGPEDKVPLRFAHEEPGRMPAPVNWACSPKDEAPLSFACEEPGRAPANWASSRYDRVLTMLKNSLEPRRRCKINACSIIQ